MTTFVADKDRLNAQARRVLTKLGSEPLTALEALRLTLYMFDSQNTRVATASQWRLIREAIYDAATTEG